MKNIDKQHINKTAGHRTIVIVMGAIISLTILVFYNSLHNDFALSWDDMDYVINNPDLKGFTVTNIGKIFSSFYNANYLPLTMFTFLAEYNLFGGSAFSFHLINLLLHLCNVCLVFFLFYVLTKRIDISAIVAVFFAIHPMHVESVAWVSERKDVLYAFFFLSSVICYVKYTQEDRIMLLIISFVLFIAACLSKSMAVTLPAILFLIDYYLERNITQKRIYEKMPFIIVSVVFVIIAMISQNTGGATNMAPEFSLLNKFFLLSYAIIYYVVMLFVPVQLCAVHYYPFATDGILPLIYYFAPLGLAIIGFGVYTLKQSKKEVIFGILFFLITIVPVLQIIPAGRAIVAERYTYITYLGLFFIIGTAFSYMKSYKTSVLLVLAVVVVIFSFLTIQRNRVWKDGLTLFSDVIDKNPKESHPYAIRANMYMTTGELTAALSDFTYAITFDTTSVDNYTNRAIVRNYLGQHAEAIEDCKAAIRLDPTNADAHSNYGFALIKFGKYQEAITFYDKAVISFMKNPIKENFAYAYCNRGFAKQALNDFNGALTDCNKAIEIDTACSEAYYIRGIAKQAKWDIEGAVRDNEHAVALNPQYKEAYKNNVKLKIFMKDYRGAISDCRNILRIDPAAVEYYFYIGSAEMRMGNTDTACETWHTASRLGVTAADEMIQKFCK